MPQINKCSLNIIEVLYSIHKGTFISPEVKQYNNHANEID